MFFLCSQIDHYAQRDLKKGLQLFGTEGNVGLTNAWMIVQTDVRQEVTIQYQKLATVDKNVFKPSDVFVPLVALRHDQHFEC